MRAPEFWTSTRLSAKLCATLLSPLGALYGASVQARRLATRPYRSRARVVCVGNLTAGGTGKTPVAIAIGEMLKARGANVCFLTRGYGGRLAGPILVDPQHHSAADVGDEALLLAGVARTILSRDRAAGAKLADTFGVDVIVMDDGLQNFQLAKDVSIAVVDTAEGFGNGHLLPAGPLREWVAVGLKLAQAIVLMGDGAPKLPPFDGPILRAKAEFIAADTLRGQPVFAFAGIGRPQKFFDMLRTAGAELRGNQSFSDHHPYTKPELTVLRLAAEKLDARLVTTEKDFVRIEPSWRDGIILVPMRAVFDDPAALAALLDRLNTAREERQA